MEIDDPENGEAFGDIEPEKPFHRPAVLFAWEIPQWLSEIHAECHKTLFWCARSYDPRIKKPAPNERLTDA